MFINAILLFVIFLLFIYAIYDLAGMDKLKGQTLLKICLTKQAKTDAIIFIVLILLLGYSLIPQMNTPISFLFATLILLSIYLAFLRSPVLILKQSGFFYGNIYFKYNSIANIYEADNNIIVIDLRNNRRLLVRLTNAQDKQKVIEFFGGYK